MKANMRTIGKWTFTIAAAAVAILCGKEGNGVGVIWPIIAAGLHWTATGYQERCKELEDEVEELIQVNRDNAKTLDEITTANRNIAKTFDEIITANHDLAEELRKEHAKNAELQEEIDRTRSLLEAERKWNA